MLFCCLLVLVKVNHPHRVQIHLHDSETGVPVGACRKTWSHHIVVDNFFGWVSDCSKKWHMVVMSMSEELSSDCVTVTIDQDVVACTPFFKVVQRRDMANYVHKLFQFLCLVQLIAQPFEVFSWICWILQEHPVFIVTGLRIQTNHTQIVCL